MQIYRAATKTTVAYDKKVNVTYGCDAATFASALNNFDSFSPYGISVVRTIYDANKNVINNLTGAANVSYVVSLPLLRKVYNTEKFLTKFYNYTGQFTTYFGESHSPLIGGTFGLNIAGVSIQFKNSSNIPYNIDAASLQAAIRASPIVGFNLVEVAQTKVNNDCGYSCTWIIQYKGFNQAVPSLTTNAAFLTGGAASPSINSFTRRSYSPSIVFSPIDYRFLNTFSNSINVQVKTNGVPAICNGSCSYAFDTYSEITSLSYTGSRLSLSLSNPNVLFNISSLSVSVGGMPCTIDNSTTTASLGCDLQNNTDNTPILVAGQLIPTVYITPYGLVGLASNTTAPNVPLVATSLSVASAGNNGGVLVSILGKGFPLDKSLMQISICNNLATIKAITNLKVDFYLPSCDSTGIKTVTISFGSITNTNLNIDYTDGSSSAPTIVSLNPPSANPGVKGTLEINGQKFGNDSSQVQVFLSNATGKIYKLSVLKVNDTYIKTGLPGGEAGNFIVQVNIVSNGDSIAVSNSNAFSYVFSISSVSPSTGSYFGGTLITIQGTNFSPEYQQTLVYIG